MKKKILRGLSLFFALAIVCSFPTLASAETAAEKYARLQKELAAIDEQIESYKDQKADAEKLRSALQEQKKALDELIEANQQQIASTEAALAAKEEEVAAKRAVIYENEQLFTQRLVAMYKMNQSSTLSNVLNVENFSDFFLMVDSLQRISVHDTDLLLLLNEQRQSLETEQAEIDGMLEELRVTYEELDTHINELAGNIAAQNNRISQAEAQIAAEEEAYDDTYAALIQAQNEMAAISSGIGGSSAGDGSEYVGGVFSWPVPGYYTISCYFGSPDPNGTPHRGMDIAAPSGATVVSCGQGTVIQASYAHYSYGNYVVVDHGAGIKTLYAHCTSLLVGAGTPVSAGTPIATVGSTGFSTGPHLHLEVQTSYGLNDPLGYLRG